MYKKRVETIRLDYTALNHDKTIQYVVTMFSLSIAVGSCWKLLEETTIQHENDKNDEMKKKMDG